MIATNTPGRFAIVQIQNSGFVKKQKTKKQKTWYLFVDIEF